MDESNKYKKMLNYFKLLMNRSETSFAEDWKNPIDSWCYMHEIDSMRESVKYMTFCDLYSYGYNEDKGRIYVQSIGYNEYKKNQKVGM